MFHEKCHEARPPTSAFGTLILPLAMEITAKSIQDAETLRDEYRSLVTVSAEQNFFEYIKKNYLAELLGSARRHMPGGWQLKDVVVIMLHWICKYPAADFYAQRHKFPGCDVGRVVGRLLHLSEGWAELHILPSSPLDRAAMLFAPPLPPELSEFASATLFSDGVEYGRTRKNIHSDASAKAWYAFKLKGPGWRAVVLSLSHTLNLISLLQHTYNRQGVVEHVTVPAPAGGKRAGERELLDDSNLFDEVMAPETDALFADAGISQLLTASYSPSRVPWLAREASKAHLFAPHQ